MYGSVSTGVSGTTRQGSIYIYVFTEGHTEVTQMLLKCTVAAAETAFRTRPARRVAHWARRGPSWAIVLL